MRRNGSAARAATGNRRWLGNAIALVALVVAAAAYVSGGSFAGAQGSVVEVSVPPGTITGYAADSPPTGWLPADGSEVSRLQYPGLFQAIGTTYGAGNGSTTFNVPDLRGRVPVGVDGAAGRLSANDTLAATGGEQKHSLTVAELPPHSHGVNDPGHSHNLFPWVGGSPINGSPGFGTLSNQWRFATEAQFDNPVYQPRAAMGVTASVGTGISIQSTGGGQAHNVMQPYEVITYMIKA